jgi:hypothetical protein
MSEANDSLRDKTRGEALSLKCFLYGTVALAMAAVLTLSADGPHSNLFVVALVGILFGFVGGILWLCSIVAGLISLAESRRALLWIIPEVVGIALFALWVISLRP